MIRRADHLARTTRQRRPTLEFAPIVPDHDTNQPEALPVGLSEIAARLGVSRRTIDGWRARKIFPDPRWRVGNRPAWSWPDIAAWDEARRAELPVHWPIEQLVERYRAGASITGLSREGAGTESTIRARLVEAGVAIRPPGRRRVEHRP